MSDKSLNAIKNSDFVNLYTMLIKGEVLNDPQKEALLKLAVVFLNYENLNISELGYRIIVLYCNSFKDYKPLYDVALRKGYMPIVKMLDANSLLYSNKNHFFHEYYASLLDSYERENIVLTEEQLALKVYFKNKAEADIVVTAPTSYGKSDLISDFCADNPEANICVVVPTKALLAQTKQRLMKRALKSDLRPVITHAEMFSSDFKKFIAVFTQERLLRFLIKFNEINFDTVFIDEAHNLLSKDSRSLLLAQVIILHKRRNSESNLKFLTPFVANHNNLELSYLSLDNKNFSVSESVKTERFYVIDFRKDSKLKLYDQFFNKFIEINSDGEINYIDFILKKSSDKSIVFFNSPKKIEKFHREITAEMNNLDDAILARACDSISELIHKDYALVKGLRKGVVYHHGSVPDIIKLYIEKMFSLASGIKYILCNSTLLEGVNLPATKLFVMENTIGSRNLRRSEFLNLSGRICRFSEVFHTDNDNLSMLEPEIYVLGTHEYIGKRANIDSFIKKVTKVDVNVDDVLDNVLLKKAKIDNYDKEKIRKEADNFLENIHPGITGEKEALTKTDVGKACYRNNISEVDILTYEQKFQIHIDEVESQIDTSNGILEFVYKCFIQYMSEQHPLHVTLKRLGEESARNFYAMMIDWRMRGVSYQEMIRNFVNYWSEKSSGGVYVGKWGEFALEGYHKPHWVNINEKSYEEKVNLAIVRIKDEYDFIDNFIIKYVEVLNDLNVLDPNLYLSMKYGTTDASKIRLLNAGINSSLASKLSENYSEYIKINEELGTVELSRLLTRKMKENGENEILIFEVSLHNGGEFEL